MMPSRARQRTPCQGTTEPRLRLCSPSRNGINRRADFSSDFCIMEAGSAGPGGQFDRLGCGGLTMYGSTLSQRQVLRRSQLFEQLTNTEIDAILAHTRVARYPEGDQIFAKGDP